MAPAQRLVENELAERVVGRRVRAGHRRGHGRIRQCARPLTTWTQAERAKGQAWGLQTIESFHTHGTPAGRLAGRGRAAPKDGAALPACSFVPVPVPVPVPDPDPRAEPRPRRTAGSQERLMSVKGAPSSLRACR